MQKVKSSIPGLGYPSGRNDPIKSGQGFMEGRRIDDGAEGLWRIKNGLYDLTEWEKFHPGGSEWINLTKGTDITEAFEVHHLTEKPQRLLARFYIRDANSSRSIPFTFDENGFYKKFKKRIQIALKDVDFQNPSKSSNFKTDSLLIITLISSMIAASTNFWLAFIISGIFLAWTTIAAHNYMHMKHHFRMYYFDLSLMSSKEWRITHALCHHLYPNTIWDQEIYAFEPLVNWLPRQKPILRRMLGIILTPLLTIMGFLKEGIKRYYLIFTVWKQLEFRDLVPFFLPLLLCTVAPNPVSAFKSWLMIIFCGSFVFFCIGINAAHHHPDIFHDGDIYRKDLDWGLLTLDTVRGRDVIDDSAFLTLTHFGAHILHHLLPTVDHAYLPLCENAFYETCQEFNINGPDRLNSLELMKGQFLQQIRSNKVNNSRM